MFIIIWSQKILCRCKGHQNAMWHHGFVTIVNMTTRSIFGYKYRERENYINIFK
jgi:hypothetical protein